MARTPTGTAPPLFAFAQAGVVFGLATTLDTRDDMGFVAAFSRANANAHLPIGHVGPCARGATLAVCGAVACGGRSPAVPPTASSAPRSEATRAEELPRSDARNSARPPSANHGTDFLLDPAPSPPTLLLGAG
mgnify:CR=1 FL=1